MVKSYAKVCLFTYLREKFFFSRDMEEIGLTEKS